jgi:hypothetical protein
VWNFGEGERLARAMTLDAKRDQVSLFVRPALRAGDKVMVMQLVGHVVAAGDAKIETQGYSPKKKGPAKSRPCEQLFDLR